MYSLSDRNVSGFRADLHCHTTCSDGSLTPEQIIDKAIEIGLSALVITDHDTIDAYEVAVPYAKRKSFCLRSGVEFSCNYEKHSVHILGYDFSLQDSQFLEYCQRQQSKRVKRNQQILEKLRKRQISIEEEDLIVQHQVPSTLGRPHIAAAMVQKGYVRSIQEAFQFYIGDNKSCFVPGDPFPIEEAISVIRQAGGKAFLAHPHLYSNSNLIRKILELPFDGMECYYGRSSDDQTKRWKKMARHKNLLISGGSDFHGDLKPHVSLGSSWVDEETFLAIFTNSPF